ncbi:MAG: serine kinase [Paracoccus sp. (in: a-proteobacteria)]|uniref:HPr kinase/phosphorylase n=1 Tax=Paracoccus sp. TaxID=267 RepID=UPI0026E052C5|nr:serine kinase [Paracoccus sp. (in: a-proteobacteria)]MDO5632784.1 serine kinase [Paracoccus sp. (in: a-proteobacteria)]
MIRSEVIHGSAVALNGRGLLILGPSGSGKSALALALMGMGAALVSDDRTVLHRAGDTVVADAPDTIRGLIEARGVGILRADPAGPVRLALVADLGRVEDARLPPRRGHDLLGVMLPLVLGPYGPHLSCALRQYLLAGRGD